MNRLTCALALSLAASAAQAHGGHGIDAANHWHATDTFGLLLVAALAGLALWYGRR